MHKIDNPYKVSVFSLRNHHPFSMVFAWLWGYEFAVLPMFSIHVQHTCLKKTDFFVSARGGQVSQLLQRVCVAPVCATNKRKHVVSDGSIHISSELMLVAQLLGCTIYHHLPRDQGKKQILNLINKPMGTGHLCAWHHQRNMNVDTPPHPNPTSTSSVTSSA